MSATASRPDHAREIRYALADAVHLCERLGLLAGRGTFVRQAGGVIIRCPVHEDRSPSCSVRRGPDGTVAWKCHACSATGDALSLIAAVHGLNTRSDFRQVLRVGAELAGLWAVVQELESGTVQQARPAPKPPAPEPPREYPPSREVEAVWSAAGPVTADDAAMKWLASRGLDGELIANDDVARVVSTETRLPRWASYRGTSWTGTGHRLLIAMRDAAGIMRSVRGCRIVDGDSPKRLPPGGHKATGLVMACSIGLAMLTGTVQPKEVVIVEGEPDFLTWVTRRTATMTARIGIVNGSWSFDIARRIPRGAEVWIRTDHDDAGNRYASELTRTLRWNGCFVRRGQS